MVKRHHGDHRVKAAQAWGLLDKPADQAGVNWSAWVNAQRLEAKRRQPADQRAVAASNIEDAGTRGHLGGDHRVEIRPPSRIGHEPEPIPAVPSIDPACRRQRAGLRDLMARMEHGSERAAMIYQHKACGADQAITSAIDSHVQGDQLHHPDEDDGQAGALAPVS